MSAVFMSKVHLSTYILK